MFNKIKGFLADDAVFYGLLIIVVAGASFGLGKLSMSSVVENQSAAVSVTQPLSDPVTAAETSDNSAKNYVASKNGTKYHLLTCPGAKQMNEANKVFFSTAEQAASAGYSPASNCPGL